MEADKSQRLQSAFWGLRSALVYFQFRYRRRETQEELEPESVGRESPWPNIRQSGRRKCPVTEGSAFLFYWYLQRIGLVPSTTREGDLSYQFPNSDVTLIQNHPHRHTRIMSDHSLGPPGPVKLTQN